jgi:hypothetical protein
MKKTLTVLAIIVCTSLTQAFTFSSNTGSAFTETKATQTKWQHTTWVDPFAGVKKLPASNQSLQDVSIYYANSNDASPSRIYFRIYVNDVLEVDLNGPFPPQLAQLSVSGGDVIRLEISTTPPDGGPDVTIQDLNTNATLFSQNDPAINLTTFSFTAEAAHSYMINSYS